MAVGMVLSIIPTCTLFLFDDDKTLKHESDAHQIVAPAADPAGDAWAFVRLSAQSCWGLACHLCRLGQYMQWP